MNLWKKIKNQRMLTILIIFVVYNIFLILYSLKIQNYYAIKGQSTFVILGILLYIFRKKLKLKSLAFTFLLAGFAVHLSHIFGKLYQNQNLFPPWDFWSHSIFFIGATIYFFELQKRRFNTEKIFTFKNIFHFLTLFLLVSGIGVLIELGEYSGYVFLEDGGYEVFGGGDYEGIVVTDEVISSIEFHGGGWFDAMTDLVINSVAILFTELILFIFLIRKKKE